MEGEGFRKRRKDEVLSEEKRLKGSQVRAGSSGPSKGSAPRPAEQLTEPHERRTVLGNSRALPPIGPAHGENLGSDPKNQELCAGGHGLRVLRTEGIKEQPAVFLFRSQSKG